MLPKLLETNDVQQLLSIVQFGLVLAGLGCLAVAAYTYWRKRNQYGACPACKLAFPLIGGAFAVAAVEAMVAGQHAEVAGNLMIGVFAALAGGKVAEKAAAR